MENVQKQLDDHEERIRNLEQDRAETKVYMKMALEKIDKMDAKLSNIHPPPEESKTWSPIVIELIKALTTAITVIGTVVGVLKFAGKG